MTATVDEIAAMMRGTRPKTAPLYPFLSFAKALPTTEERDTTYSGFYADYGRNDDFDAACQEAGIENGTIFHENTGNTEVKWFFPSVEGTIIAEMIQHINEDLGDDEANLNDGKPLRRYGIAMGWKDEHGKRPLSFMKIPLVIRDLGYNAPVVLTLKSTITTDVSNDLVRHIREVIAGGIYPLMTKANKPFPLKPYGASIVFTAAGSVKRGKEGATKTFKRPGLAIPENISAENPEHLKWLRERFSVAQAQRDIVESYLDEMIAWSIEQSRKDIVGVTIRS